MTLQFEPYARQAIWRRGLVFTLLAITVAGGANFLYAVLGTNGLSWAETGLMLIFAVVVAWIALPFWSAVIGFLLSAFGRHPITFKPLSRMWTEPLQLSQRVAIVMPIYNEDPERVFAGLSAVYRSLEATGALAQFDFFVLSDTTKPEVQQAEELLWRRSCWQLSANGRLYYRHREANIGRKAGNIAEWLSRWGAAYESFVVLDADSLMAGETLVRLAALMEANPRAGIIQTLALAANRQTPFARSLQFAGRLYAPILALGQSFWQLGEANYLGHNAILRCRAFAEHCALPKLPGKPPLGGEIMSHDFVEAAMIRRGGWQVWFVPELEGSFEELPSNIYDYATRDRRWAQGNLQHARIITGRGFHWMNRLHLTLGVLAFTVSPLWLLLLILSSYVVVGQAITGHIYFPEDYSLFPIWPEYRPFESMALLVGTGILLFLPKLLSLALVLSRRTRRSQFGGVLGLAVSAVSELAFSVLLAPIMMLLHTGFVTRILAGSSVGWGSQRRDDHRLGWFSAIKLHFGHMVIGLAWGFIIWWFAPAFLWWIAPVVVGLVAAAWVNVTSSRAGLGQALRRLGLYLTPDETAPSPLLRLFQREASETAGQAEGEAQEPGFFGGSWAAAAANPSGGGSRPSEVLGSVNRPAAEGTKRGLPTVMTPPPAPLEMPEQRF